MSALNNTFRGRLSLLLIAALGALSIWLSGTAVVWAQAGEGANVESAPAQEAGSASAQEAESMPAQEAGQSPSRRDVSAPEQGKPAGFIKLKGKDGNVKIVPVRMKSGGHKHAGNGKRHKASRKLANVKEMTKPNGVMERLWQSTGLYGFTSTRYSLICPNPECHHKVLCPDAKHHPRCCDKCKQIITGHDLEIKTEYGWGNLVMIAISIVLMYLAIVKGFEPLLLLPIGFGGLLSNIPLAGIADAGGFLYAVRDFGINPDSCLFPLLIFMGVGAMTDFGPLIANPRTALLGGAAQFGIFFALIGAVLLNDYCPGIEFSLKDAASIGIIGGADGPTSIFLSSKLAPNLVGSIAVAAYSYMALVPIIQPPIMRWLTTKEERAIVMPQLRPVSKLEKVLFPLTVLLLCALLLPSAAPLIGALMFGNLAKECNVVGRLSDTMQNAMMNIVTILLGLCVGSKLAAAEFLTPRTLGILFLGLCAFSVGTAAGVLLAKLMNKLSKTPINPLIGAAGVSAVPMAARVVNKVGQEENPSNFLLMNAMGPNVAGVIGSAVAAGVLLAFLG